MTAEEQCAKCRVNLPPVWSRVPLIEPVVPQQVKEFHATMESEGLLPCSQELCLQSTHYILLCSVLTKNMYALLIPSLHTTCHIS
jgi:hypothetical protein